ncbi:MAG: hypothetical protein HC910_08910 [Spirulinaceae cyanobacterium SM2_1_0]|nr:hypothetical protein [Spirulinaceae cyanobacterium SM2_1_0]
MKKLPADRPAITAFAPQKRCYQNITAIAPLQTDLDELIRWQDYVKTQIDHYTRKRNTWVSWSAVAVITVFLSISLITAAGSIGVFLGVPGFLVAVGVAAYTGSRAKKFYEQLQFFEARGFSERSYRHECLSRLLTLLERDIAPDQKLRLRLDLAPITDSRKSVSKAPNRRHRERQNEYFEDNWLKLRSAFADGTKFQLTVLERYIVCTWRNQNNNARRREKHKGFKIDLALRYAAEQHADLARLANIARSAVQLPQVAQLQGLEIQRDRLAMKVTLPQEASAALLAQTITLMLLSAYQILNLARIRANQAS